MSENTTDLDPAIVEYGNNNRIYLKFYLSFFLLLSFYFFVTYKVTLKYYLILELNHSDRSCEESGLCHILKETTNLRGDAVKSQGSIKSFWIFFIKYFDQHVCSQERNFAVPTMKNINHIGDEFNEIYWEHCIYMYSAVIGTSILFSFATKLIFKMLRKAAPQIASLK